MRIRKLHVVAGVLALAVGSGVTAAAQEGAGSGDNFTGCLGRGGLITLVAVGDEPLRDCRRRTTEITWSQGVSPAELQELTSRVAELETRSGPIAYRTGNGDTVFNPGDPAVDFMLLDLPAGDYVVDVNLEAFPQVIPDPEGGVPSLGPGGAVECRFFELASDGARTEATGTLVNVSIEDDGSEGRESVSANVDITIRSDGASLALTCQAAEEGGRIDILAAKMIATAVGEFR